MFGAHFHLPGKDKLDHFSWVSPFPADDKQYAVARPVVDTLAMALDGLLISKDNPHYNPVPFAEAEANGWLMLDDNGQPVPYSGGDGRYVCDPAAKGYAEAWAEGAIAKAREYGCDYIWIDSIANEKLRWIVERDKIPAKYRAKDDAAGAEWLEAINKWLSYVSPAIREAGLRVAVNTGDRRWLSGLISWVALFSDAMMNEGAFFSILGNGEYETPLACDKLIVEIQLVEKKALLLSKIPQSCADFDKKVGFALGCFLIAQKEGDVFLLWDEKPREEWYPVWSGWHTSFDKALALGRPLTRPRKWFGWWWRLYRGGLVMVDTQKRQVQWV